MSWYFHLFICYTCFFESWDLGVDCELILGSPGYFVLLVTVISSPSHNPLKLTQRKASKQPNTKASESNTRPTLSTGTARLRRKTLLRSLY